MLKKYGPWIIVTISLLWLTACTSTLPLYTHQDKQLEQGNGWLALPTESPVAVLELEFDSGVNSYRSPGLPYGRSFAMVQLPAGEYFLGSYQVNGQLYQPKNRNNRKNIPFIIEAGAINYFGDVVVGRVEGRHDQISYRVEPNLENLQEVLKKYYPELSDLNLNISVIEDRPESN